jgi:hypothetical protein
LDKFVDGDRTTTALDTVDVGNGHAAPSRQLLCGDAACSSSPLDNAAEGLVKLGFTARGLLRINHWHP